jgi:outer membrane protein
VTIFAAQFSRSDRSLPFLGPQPAESLQQQLGTMVAFRHPSLGGQTRPQLTQEVSMKKCFPMLLLLALAFPLQASADEMVSLKVGYQELSPSGNFTGTENGIGTSVDIEDDLNFDDSEDVTAEVALQLGSFRLSAGYLPLKFSGTGTLTQDFFFNGKQYTVGEAVKGDIDVDLYDVGLTWYLLNFDDLPVRLQLGPEIAVKIVDGDLSVDSRTTGIRESVSGTAAVPTIGARARVGISDFIALVGRVGYVEYDDNTFLDADAQIEISPIPLVGIYGGYRYLDIDVDESDIVLNATFEGPYAGAFLRF